MKPKYVVGNWKMNHNLASIKEFFMGLDRMKMELKCEAWIAPQFVHIPILKDLAFSLGKAKIGAQNSAIAESGAHTGEVSPATLADMGVEFVILGHSERRSIYKESNEVINQKVTLALNNSLKVIFCVGETLEERENNKTFEVVRQQLHQGLKGLMWNSDLMVAYEPVWAIGTGKTATPDQAEEVHAFIRKELSLQFGEQGKVIPLLYGGSVKPDNFGELLSKPSIDGGLVGGASLKIADYGALCSIASSYY